MTGYKGVNIYHMVSIVGIVAVLVILSIIFSKDRGLEFAEEKNIYEGVVLEDEGVSVLGAYSSPLFFDEIIGSIPTQGVVENNSFTDNQNGFEFAVSEDFSQESDAVARLPFYWQERYEGETFNNDVEMFVINNSYQSFVSGITYGLGETFVTENEIVVTPRTTGYGDKFLHQAYVDLQEGKTLMFELRTNTSNYPTELKSYIETFEQV